VSGRRCWSCCGMFIVNTLLTITSGDGHAARHYGATGNDVIIRHRAIDARRRNDRPTTGRPPPTTHTERERERERTVFSLRYVQTQQTALRILIRLLFIASLHRPTRHNLTVELSPVGRCELAITRQYVRLPVG